jgi:replicative DNA helicase
LTDRVPFSDENERALLSCFLQAERAIDEAGEVREDDFFVSRYRVVYAAIRAMREKRHPVDFVTVSDEMVRRGTLGMLGEDSLIAISNHVPLWHTVRHYATMVTRDGTLRRLMAMCADLTERARRGDEAPELVAEARRSLADMELRRDGGPVRVGDKMGELFERLEAKRGDADSYRVSSGIPAFDKLIGGFRAPQLIVVAARPGIGKTSFAGTAALRAAKRGIPSLIFSLEMGFFELAERFLGAHARFPVERMTRGELSKQEYAHLYGFSGDLQRLPLFVDDRVLTIGQIGATARSWRLRQQTKQVLIVIDYLGLVRSSGKSETRALEVGRMAWGAKTLAKDLDAPVVLVAQLNRAMEKEGREPMLSDLRDSGEIEAHADMVVFPHRTPPLEQSGPASLIVAKNRGGKVGKVDCWWHGEFMTFDGRASDEAQDRGVA